MEELPKMTHIFDDWADRGKATRLQFHARERYEYYKRLQEASQRNHVDYGRWLIASLLAVHGGAVYAISGIRSSVGPAQLESLISGAAWNLAGVVFTIFAGFFAWLNFQFAEHIYGEWANPEMVYRNDRWPKDRKRDPVGATLYLSAAAGFFSMYCFVASAVTVIQALKLSH